MNLSLPRATSLLMLCLSAFFSQSQITDVYTSSATWTVPAGISTITIKVYGGAGGTGGQDCGSGCTNTAAGPVGFVLADFSVTTGDVIGIFPGGNGANGTNNASGSGGGSGGIASYNTAYNGGIGGNAGSAGSSGGGGGGGAASIVTINSTIVIVAGGAGGGGGMANQVNSGTNGQSTTSFNGTSTTGGAGTIPAGDGGGGGGGGGGDFGSIGGGVHVAGGEHAGDGGFLGGNSVTGASTVTTNGNIARTSPSQIEITHLFALPVTMVSFTAVKQGNGVLLSWSTATELNSRDFKVQRSATTSNWTDAGIVQAVGNSNSVKQYSFLDENPGHGINYYRLLQRDINGNIAYSKIVSIDLSSTVGTLKIYPNPVLNGSITVSLDRQSVLWIYNSVGSKLMEQEYSAGDHVLDVSKFARGTYFIKVNGGAAVFVVQ